MQLEVTVDRLVVNSHDSSIVVYVSSANSTVDDDEFCRQRDRLAAAKLSKSGVRNKVPTGRTLILEIPEFYYNSVGYVEGSLRAKTNSIRPSVSIERRPVRLG